MHNGFNGMYNPLINATEQIQGIYKVIRDNPANPPNCHHTKNWCIEQLLETVDQNLIVYLSF
jgi:hypothetical protein